MMTLPILSQSIKKDSVTIAKPTFANIIKEAEKCDSLYTAYQLKSNLLDTLVLQNTLIFTDLTAIQKRHAEVKTELAKAQTEQIKQARKLKNKTRLIVGGALAGIIVGVLIAK